MTSIGTVRAGGFEIESMSMETVYQSEEIADRIEVLGQAIREESGDGDVTLLGVLKGTTIFLADLLRAVDGPVNYEWINVVRSVADTQTADALQINFISNFFLDGGKVYILKDVVSTGVIESYLVTQLRQKLQASDVRLVALLDRPELRTVPLEVDHAAFTVGKGVFVGYGLELDNKYSGLRDICML